MVTELNAVRQKSLPGSLLLASEGCWASSGLPRGSILAASWLPVSRKAVALNHRGQGHSCWWEAAAGDVPVSDGICSLALFRPAGSWPARYRGQAVLWCESQSVLPWARSLHPVSILLGPVSLLSQRGSPGKNCHRLLTPNMLCLCVFYHF